MQNSFSVTKQDDSEVILNSSKINLKSLYMPYLIESVQLED